MKNEMPLTTAQQAVFGMPEMRVGTVAIAQVQPLFSVGQLSADARSGDVRPGDIVRSEPRMEVQGQ